MLSGRNTDRGAQLSTLKEFSMNIGHHPSKNLSYRVSSRAHQPVPFILNKEAQALLKLEGTIALWNYNSPQALLLVSLQLPIPAG